MKAPWIMISLCLAGSPVLAQSAGKTDVDLDACFKLLPATEANCSTSAGDDAQRQECLQNARKMQRACFELAGSQSSAPVDRPPTAAEPASSDKPVESVSPALPVTPPAKPVEAAPPVTVTASTSAPKVAPGNWTVSEMSSPVDYSPVVTATIRARSENRITPAALVVRCRGGRSELALRMEGIPRPSRGGEILVAQQFNDQPAVKTRWTAAADAKTANYKGDAAALLQSFSEDSRLKIVVSDGSGRDSEAAFQFAGWNAIRDRIAAACMWSATVSKSSGRR